MHAAPLILTFHSISDRPGPTSIPEPVFAMQMRELADRGYRALTPDDFARWHRGDHLPDRAVLITFDDAFVDFAQAAAPLLEQHGFPALVFVPTGRLGAPERWHGADDPARALMTWEDVTALAARNVHFGGHSRTHANLAALPPDALEEEVAGCRADLAARLAAPADCFAAPYGATDTNVVAAIARHWGLGFGTRLGIAEQGRNTHDLPRIEMHYFRRRSHWRRLLDGGTAWLRARQLLRGVRTRTETAFG